MTTFFDDAMTKMTENNPLLAMMRDASGADGVVGKNASDAWQKMAQMSMKPSQLVAASASASAIGMSMYAQWLGTINGAMTTAAQAADEAGVSKPVLFNPLTFEWTNIGADELEQEASVEVEKAAPAARTTEEKSVANNEAAVMDEPVAEPAPAEPDTSAVVAPSEFEKPAAIAKPANPDDLKLVSGIGPKLEKVLNGLGVWTFSQIADWTPAQIAWVDDLLQFNGRIERDQWLSQASELAGAAKV